MGNISHSVNEPKLKHFILAFPIYLYVKLLQYTLRINIDKKSKQYLDSPERFIGLTWHNRIIYLPIFKYVFRKKFPMSGLVSASRDGAFLCAVFKLMDISAVRGSHKRGGSSAIFGLIDTVKTKSDVFITPDGPRGPKYKSKSGFVLVAKESNARILTLHINAKSYLKVPKTWDSLKIPLPFSKVDFAVRQFTYDELLKQSQAKDEKIEEIITKALTDNIID